VPRSMSFASRYSSAHFLYPSPFKDPDGFMRTIIEQVGRLGVRVLIPVFEETFLIAKHKADLASRVSMVIPDYGQILAAHNKRDWEPMAQALDIPVPSSYSPDELRGGGARDIRYPVLIKPKQGGGAWGIEEAPTAGALEEMLARETHSGKPWERFFVQEKIAGHTHCVAMLFNQAQLRATVGYRQLRDYPAKGGQATLRISVRHEQAEESFRRLLEQMHWHGPCQADFMVDEQTGVAYLIDINPRLWGSLTQAIASGVDFPHLIYRIARDGDVEPVTTYRTGVVTRWIGGELAALPERLRHAESKRRVVTNFLFPRQRAALLDDFSMSDPLPFMMWTLDALSRAARFGAAQPAAHDSLEGVWE
jgi:predicted ATP-grasp superfamily ATP-dependent carboligase